MKVYISRRTHVKRGLRRLIPVVFMALLIGLFCAAVHSASRQSLIIQKEALTKALRHGAISTYALTGVYPESLEELLSSYHITYNPEQFLVEYVPMGSNLFPSIFVLPLRSDEQ